MAAEAWPESGHLVVVGQSGLGKSSLVRSLIRHSHQRWPSKVLVVDPAAEYGQVAVGVSSLEQWAQYTAAGFGGGLPEWRVAYQGDDLDVALPAICEATFEMAPSMTVVEEADLWCSPYKITPELAHLIKYGRKRAAWVCSVFRFASEVNRLMTSQARHFISFGHSEPSHLDYIRGATSKEMADAVATLPELVCIWWDRRTRQLVRWHVDPAALTIARIA